MSQFSVFERVVYLRQMIGGRFQELPATVLKVTRTGRYFIKTDSGEKVTVAQSSLVHPGK